MFKCFALALILSSAAMAGLRYYAVIDWSWWLILAPLYVPVFVLGLLCVVGMALLAREAGRSVEE